MPTKLPPWKEFIDSGKFDAIERKPIVVGDHVVTREDDRNKIVKSIDSASGKVTIFDGKETYEYPVKDIRHTQDIAELTFKDFGIIGTYEKREEQKGVLKWVKDFGSVKGGGRAH